MSVTKPTVGGSTNTWGTVLNDALDELDTRIDANAVSIAAALPKAGGTLTGRVISKTESMTRVTLGNHAGDVTFDLSAGNYFTMTCTAATNWIFSNIPAGAIATGWIVRVTNPGNFAITFAAGAAIRWPGAVTPTFTTGGTDVLVFITDDDGTKIRASVLATDQ